VGRSGKLVVDRAYTPPPGYAPSVQIERAGRREVLSLPPDNHYRNMLAFFARTLRDESAYAGQWEELERQARQVDRVRQKGTRL
jgi:NDP-hexose-3-ketoreductase